ncbi:MAG: hypothetical protein UY75_C0006G0021, partial [Parcubacteria group bacterium GW2011_GWC2_52_8c]
MDRLTRYQFVVLVGVAAFLAASAGTALTWNAMQNGGAPMGFDLNSLRTLGSPKPTEKEINERILRQDEMVVQVVAA